MFCTNCGEQIDDKAVICVHCGVPTHNMVASNVVNVQQQEQPAKSVNGLGVAGFIVSLASLWFGVFFAIPCIVGTVLSIVGMVKAKNHRLNGLAIAGLAIGICATLIWIFYWFEMIISGALYY